MPCCFSSRTPVTLVLFLFLAFGLFAPSAMAAKTATEKVTLDFRDVEMTDLIQTVSELTGRNFVYDDTVRGKATIISPEEMSKDEAYEVFLAVLNIKGFTVVPSGKLNKIVPVRSAKESNLPTITEGERDATERYVTRLVPLQNVDASVVATTVLTPLIPKTSSVVAYTPSNTLIITDTAANIERLVEIIAQLDLPSALEQLEVISLNYAAADEVAQICSQVITQVTANPRRGRGATNVQSGGTNTASKVIPYDRTNALVVMASGDDLTTIRDLVSRLDEKQAQERSHINVYYLENADAETLGKTLNEIVTGVKTQSAQKQRAIKTPAQQQAAPLAGDAVTITADKPTNSLVINSSPEDYEVIKEIIRKLDIKRKQVFVEALILELSMDATKKLGTSLQGAAGVGSEGAVFGVTNQNGGIANLGDVDGDSVPDLLSQTVDGIMLGGLFNMINVTGADGNSMSVPALSALIDLSRTDADVNILSAPRLLTSDNEEAEIVVGSNVPIITSRLTNAVSTSTTTSSGLATSVSVERKDVALTLRFTPQVTDGDLVRLKVYQEITDIAQNSVGDVDQVGPTFTKRLLQNTVVAENGRTVVLGGLIGTNVQEVVTKVPFLGDIPLLGWLFKSKSKSEAKTNLLIFITPHIIKNGEDLAAVTSRSRGMMDRFKKVNLRKEGELEALEAELLNVADEAVTTTPAEGTMTAPVEETVPATDEATDTEESHEE
ncbi:MAG: type II secretion system protein GspD [Desulfuromonas sp.]|nr:MAG: type II secretion system protein GspD [Desulfuromonas sp.]